jgi:hypothetical protein
MKLKNKVSFLFLSILLSCYLHKEPNPSNFISVYSSDGKVFLFPEETKWVGFPPGSMPVLKQIQEFSFLESLELVENKINDLESLNALSLYYLNLSDTDIISIAPIRSVRTLHSLVLNRTQIDSLQGIEQLKNLTRLEIAHTKILDLSPLQNNLKLRHLNLQYTNIHDISILSKSYLLRELYLKGSKVSSLKSLYGLEELTYLEIPKEVSQEEIQKFRKQNPYCKVFY